MTTLPEWTPAERRRFIGYIKPTPNGCWSWTGRTIKTGRGYFQARNKRIIAPRVSYSMFVGIIPDALVVMHSCDNPNCVNPSHLVAGTQLQNIADRDAKQRNRRSHFRCVNGHEFTPENTRLYGPNGNWRMCRECCRQRSAAFRTRIEAENY